MVDEGGPFAAVGKAEGGGGGNIGATAGSTLDQAVGYEEVIGGDGGPPAKEQRRREGALGGQPDALAEGAVLDGPGHRPGELTEQRGRAGGPVPERGHQAPKLTGPCHFHRSGSVFHGPLMSH